MAAGSGQSRPPLKDPRPFRDRPEYAELECRALNEHLRQLTSNQSIDLSLKRPPGSMKEFVAFFEALVSQLVGSSFSLQGVDSMFVFVST